MNTFLRWTGVCVSLPRLACRAMVRLSKGGGVAIAEKQLILLSGMMG